MSSFISDILSDNFFEKCVNDSFTSLNCILGSSVFALSILVISLNCFAFYKLFKFFHKLNLQTSLILLDIIQLLIILLLIITCYAMLIELFNVVQIGMLTWIIRKFNILLKNPIRFFKKNKLFFFLNILNILLFIYYIVLLFVKEPENYNYPIILTHTFFSFACSCILVIYSCSLISRIKIINESEKDLLKRVIGSSGGGNNNPLLVNKNNGGPSNSKEIIFYSKRERQIKPLFKINLVCTFLEFSLLFSILFVPNIIFQKDYYKIIPQSVMSHIFYYLFIFVCIVNTFANFFCFFWNIKKQYNLNPQIKNAIMTSAYLRKQKIEMENNRDDPNMIEEVLDHDIYNNYNNKYEDNDFNSSFEELFVEKQNNNKNLVEDLKSNDIRNDNSLRKDETDNKELLNNEVKNRESINIDFDSHFGINRISRNTTSNLKEEN